MLLKSKKEEILKDLEQIVEGAKSLVLVNFHGMNVADETILRRNLREKKVGYKVSRKTLLSRALSGKAKGDLPELPGEVAVAYSSLDQTTPPREIYNFSATHKGLLSILGGIFEGEFVGREKMTELAMIPSREVLYAKFVNLINSPIQRLVVTLNQIAKIKS